VAELAGVISVLAAYGGWLAIALRQRRHGTTVSGARLDPRARARALFLGLVLLVVSIAAAIQGHGASFGSLFGVLALCFGAGAVTLTLSYRPGWVRPVAKLLTIGAQHPELRRNGESA
jgi:hypothetical protein